MFIAVKRISCPCLKKARSDGSETERFQFVKYLLFNNKVFCKLKPNHISLVWCMSPKETLPSVRSVYRVALVHIDCCYCRRLWIKMSLEQWSFLEVLVLEEILQNTHVPSRTCKNTVNRQKDIDNFISSQDSEAFQVSSKYMPICRENTPMLTIKLLINNYQQITHNYKYVTNEFSKQLENLYRYLEILFKGFQDSGRNFLTTQKTHTSLDTIRNINMFRCFLLYLAKYSTPYLLHKFT